MRTCVLALLFTLLTACGEHSDNSPAGGLSSYRGQWVVVNYWAKWCKPCIEEIPELNRLNEEHADIQVLGVNYDGLTDDALAAQVAELGVDFPIIPDPAAELGTPRPVVLPTTLILDADGALVKTLVGPQTGESLLAEIKKPAQGAG
ncbi:TlpA family protein disulfide reductase [Parahaliea aestuarii]|uniref:TlpA family protein disulfide reductase n=1 Tax=Parahaliea aestuarii TaxID=1852021 RepID=A0A5C8ZMF7_9GAMM|nr:TlpA disulfide reductase family protein [Parahaliea aestuarii]TXS89746.1 TlpA family protein disulfide reductase [Parahaliea aestuarii]